MSDLSSVTTFVVPRSVIQRGHRHLRDLGRQGFESFVLWVGERERDSFRVRDVVVPEQTGHRTAAGVGVTVFGEALHRLNVYLFEHGWTLAAQLHSHPDEAYHSVTDDTYAIATQLGSLSIVVPDFAVRPFSIERSAIYRLQANGWTPLEVDEAKRLIRVEA